MNDGSKLGYVPQEEEELKNAIKEAFAKVKDAMDSPWGTLIGVMDAEWVGPDQVAAEKGLAKKLKECYKSCVDVVKELGENINAVHDTWVSFQESNQIENGEAVETGKIADLEAFAVDENEPELKVEDKTFAKGDFIGLVNGVASAQKVHTAAVEYATTVKKSVADLYEAIETNKAYFGESQVDAIKNLITKVAEILQDLTTAFKDVDEAISEAIKAYKTEESEISEKANAYDKDYDKSNVMGGE